MGTAKLRGGVRGGVTVVLDDVSESAREGVLLVLEAQVRRACTGALVGGVMRMVAGFAARVGFGAGVSFGCGGLRGGRADVQVLPCFVEGLRSVWKLGEVAGLTLRVAGGLACVEQVVGLWLSVCWCCLLVYCSRSRISWVEAVGFESQAAVGVLVVR